ncbi:MAG: hypothetical protein WED07_03290 [Candidatus Freyarchaeum deiterrae]
MDNEQFEKLMKKIDLLVKLTSLNAIGNKKFKEQVRILDGLELQPKDIAKILGRTRNQVNVTLHGLREEEKKMEEETDE